MSEQTEFTPEEQRQAEQKAFDAAVDAPEKAAPATPEKIVTPEAKEPEKKPETPPDPWEGVPKVVRESLESITGKLGALDTLTHEVKSTTGRIAAIQREMAVAKAAPRPAGDGPTKTQITEAATSLKTWEKLKDEFPDWAAGLAEYVAADRAELLKQLKSQSLDVDGIKKDVSVTFADAIRQSEARAERRAQEIVERARIEDRHSEWENTIKSPEFFSWSYTGVPADEAKHYLALTTPEEADAAWAAMRTKYPQWWAEKGVLMESMKSSDSIKLLDAYQKYRKVDAERLEKQKQDEDRLARATPAKGTAHPVHQSLTDQEAAQRAFESVFT